eukprot:833872-Prorocentrum_lima.AAC.1
MAVRAATKCRPEMALVTLDIKKAFGTVRWSDALQQAMTHLPSVAVPVANMTRSGSIQTHAQTSSGEWRPVRIHGGIPQGSYESSPLF